MHSLIQQFVFVLYFIFRSIFFSGKGILFDYLSQGTKERLTAPMIKCVMALGRRALVECLGDYLDHLDDCIHSQTMLRRRLQPDLREAILVSTMRRNVDFFTGKTYVQSTQICFVYFVCDNIFPNNFPKKSIYGFFTLSNLNLRQYVT